MTLYMEKGGIACWGLKNFRELVKDGRCPDGFVLAEMKKDENNDRWCCFESVHVDDGYCGRDCRDYAPCNKVSGKCRYLRNCYVETGREFLLDKKGLHEIKVG